MPPSVYDTHCDGPGALATTKIYGFLRRKWCQYIGDDFTDQPLPPKQDLSGKTIIVTGSNSGIGKEAAGVFASWGANVILACRDPPPHEQHPEDTIKELMQRYPRIKQSQLEWWEIDFASLDSVRAFGKRWRESGRVCDVLCNNAGIGGVKGRVITKDGFELVNQINFLSHCLLTLYILPSMKKSPAPRIVSTASIFHFGGVLDFADFDNEKLSATGTHGVQFYCNAKLRLMIWTVELQRRLSRSDSYRHVITHGCHPGFVGSNIWMNPTIQAMPWPIPQLLNFLCRRFAITPYQGSQTIIHCAVRSDLGLPKEYLTQALTTGKVPSVPEGLTARVGGQYVSRVHANRKRRPECDDPLVRARLWQRVLEDLKKYREQDDLEQGLPTHSQGILGVEKK